MCPTSFLFSLSTHSSVVVESFIHEGEHFVIEAEWGKLWENCPYMKVAMFTVIVWPLKVNTVVAFRGMHVSPAKHSYAWLPIKCDYRTDTQTDTQTPDKLSLCSTMLRMRHRKDAIVMRKTVSRTGKETSQLSSDFICSIKTVYRTFIDTHVDTMWRQKLARITITFFKIVIHYTMYLVELPINTLFWLCLLWSWLSALI